MTRVLVATADTIGPRMAGPAIRASNVALVLSERHETQLVTTGRVEGPSGLGIDAESVDADRFDELLRWAEVVVFQGWVMADHPSLAATDRILVADVYDPMHLEQLEQGRDAGPGGHLDAVADCVRVLNQQLLRADFLLCASERQRDFWLGQLAGLGRLNPATYEADTSLRSLIDVAPFGLPAEPPRRPTQPDDATRRGGEKVILWGGGIYNWFDPMTLLHAVDKLRHRIPEVHLVFLGTTHPSPTIPTMHVAFQARALAESLGLSGRWVSFNDGWVPYVDRGAHLLAADVGVTTHLHHIETEFSFRTRVLDYLWARLPIVATSGDALADLVAAENLGIVVPPGDAASLAGALETTLTDEGRRALWRTNADRVAPSFEWSTVLEPLLRFCDSPRRAPDHLDPATLRRLDPGSRLRPRSSVKASIARAREVVERDGLGGLGRGLARRGQRALTRRLEG